MSKNLIIYGAGVAGKLFYEQIRNDISYSVIAFIDDSKEADGDMVNGVRVYPSSFLENLLDMNSVSKVIVAIPSINNKQRNEISSRLIGLGVDTVFLPSHQQIIQGKVELDNSSFLKIIGRDGSGESPESHYQAFRGLNILVTGGGGSIGSEITRQVLLGEPNKLFVLDNSELHLFKLSKKLIPTNNSKIEYVLGDYGDELLINRLMSEHCLDFVFHAGAYKHVALVEDNIFAAIKNNVIGSNTLFNTILSHKNGKKVKIINISTDKAVRPTSIMGATKRVVELLTAYFCQKFGNKIVNVRFGNVFGSSGSVIPIFVDQINQGGPVTVTHPEVERYFMSIPEAVELVLYSSLISEKSGTYFLDMGDPIKILGLAERLIKSFGLTPVITDDEVVSDNEIRILFSGLKQGEKLSEELSLSENFKYTDNPKIFLCNEPETFSEDIHILYKTLIEQYMLESKSGLFTLLKSKLIGYKNNDHH